MKRRNKNRDVTLPLTSLIDIFSILVMFLLLGTYFAPADLILPEDFELPRSVNKDTVELASQVVVTKDKVMFPSKNIEMSLRPYRAASSDSAGSSRFRKQIAKLIAELPPESRQNGVIVNLVADKNLPYRIVYNVVVDLRRANVDSILFVANGG